MLPESVYIIFIEAKDLDKLMDEKLTSALMGASYLVVNGFGEPAKASEVILAVGLGVKTK
jgi:hypothetical protein